MSLIILPAGLLAYRRSRVTSNVRPHHVASDLTAAIDTPWGLAGMFLLVLAPRVILRLREPSGLLIIGRMRLLTGYTVAVVLAVAAEALAGPLNLRAWTDGTPVRAAVELMAVSAFAKYALAALIAWATAAFLVAPVTAWLATHSLANGLLVVAVCLPIGVILGIANRLAWLAPSRSLGFNIACSLVLISSTAIGFSIGAGVPLSIRRASKSAA